MELVDALETTQIGCRGMFCLASFHFERIGHCRVLIPPRNVEGVVLTVAILSFANQLQLVTVFYKINVLIELKVLLF